MKTGRSKGFSPRNPKYMCKFAESRGDRVFFMQRTVAQISNSLSDDLKFSLPTAVEIEQELGRKEQRLDTIE